MAKAEAKVPKSLIIALQRSGFPFQTAVRQVIHDSKKWCVDSSEYPWRTMGGDEQFLDIVATNGSLFLTIECKKTRTEILTFLRPLGYADTGKEATFRCLHAGEWRDAIRIGMGILCEDWNLDPTSTHSELCVVSTSESGRDQRLLEKDAGLLVRATDAFARDFVERVDPNSCRPPSPPRLFVPVIVTNAPIYTARYSPRDVSLKTGEFSTPPDEVEEAESVRFRKAFTSDGASDLGDRSVFVVHADSFLKFLQLITIAPDQPENRSEAYFYRRSKL